MARMPTAFRAATACDAKIYALFMVIADETDAAARAKWELCKAG